jgi:Mrp family chromosome partitioning ATPase
VLLIDGDLRTGTLSRRLGHAESPGLSHAVATGADLDEVLVELGPGLSLVPAQPELRTPPGLLYSDRMRSLLSEARTRFDLVLVDCPPVGQLADGLLLASLADGTAIVARTDLTKRQELEATMATINQTGTPVLGVVVFEARPIDKTYYPAALERPPLFQSPASS